MSRGAQNSGRGNRYINNGSKREDPLHDKRRPTTTVGSGLPTPEFETKKLPAEPARNNPNPPEMVTPPSQSTSRTGKAAERSIPDITPTDDMKSIGAILGAINQNVAKLENTLESMNKQAAALTALHAPLKLQEEYRTVRQGLQQQIQRQNEELKRKRDELQDLLKRQLDERIKQRINAEVQDIVKQKVAERIQAELDRLIPQELKNQSQLHRERMLHIRSSLINNEARRRNANAGRHLLHRLVVSRPVAISRSSSGSTASPSTAGGLPSTPLDSSLLFSNARNQPALNDGYSPVFPKNSHDLFNCYKDRGTIQQLLEEYEGPDALIDVKNDFQVVDAIDKLGHNFGILGPGDRLVLPPGPVEGQLLSPLIMSADY